MSGRDILLDTCVILWLSQGAGLAGDSQIAIEEAVNGGAALRVSPISAWEIGQLVRKGRLLLAQQPDAWFEDFCSQDRFALAGMPPSVLFASAFLPGAPPEDPAGRILAATAREYGYSLATRDPELLGYADAGHINAIAC